MVHFARIGARRARVRRPVVVWSHVTPHNLRVSVHCTVETRQEYRVVGLACVREWTKLTEKKKTRKRARGCAVRVRARRRADDCVVSCFRGSTLAREIDTMISLFTRRPRYCVGILTSGVSVSLWDTSGAGGARAASAGGPVGLLRYRQA